MRTLTIGGIAHAPDGSGYYRFYLPFKHLGENSRHIVGMAPPGQQPPLTKDELKDVDVLALQRPAGPYGTRQLERLVGGHTRLVYETDDDLLRVESSGLPHLDDERTRASVKRCLRLVDLVTVSTDYLAEQVRPYNPNVRVLPNFVKQGLLDLPRPHRDRLVVGWAGGTSHLVDMVTVADPLRRVLEANPQVDMHWIGFDFTPELTRAKTSSPLGPRCRWTRWEPDVGAYYKRIDFDIAIAPLADVPFNYSKSHIRVLEMAALGIPVVASNVLPYADFVVDGKTGYLVDGEEEFERRLTELIHDPAAREELGQAAKEQARAHTIEQNWPLWEAAYESLFEEER